MTNNVDFSRPPLELMQQHMAEITGVVPWARRLGFRITHVEKGKVKGLQPYKDRLVGDPDTGIIHGGVITSFLDNLCGTSCASVMEKARFVATLDLRIDYMRPAEPGRDIIGEAECYHMTRTIAFTRAWAYHETREKVIATAAGAFAVTKPRPASDFAGRDNG